VNSATEESFVRRLQMALKTNHCMYGDNTQENPARIMLECEAPSSWVVVDDGCMLQLSQDYRGPA